MSEKFTAFIVVFVSLLFLVSAGIMGVSLWVFIQNAEFASGKVVELKSGQKRLQAPKVLFLAKDEKTYTFVSNTYAENRYQIGDSVEVLYSPENPSNALVYNFVDAWGTSFLFGVLGTPFFVIGMVMLVKAFGNRRLPRRYITPVP